MAAAAMAIAIAPHQFEFYVLYFDWNDNAYASVVWALLLGAWLVIYVVVFWSP
jgi:hypothetical protein